MKMNYKYINIFYDIEFDLFVEIFIKRLCSQLLKTARAKKNACGKNTS